MKNKKKKNEVEHITEEELAEVLGYDFIAGFTPGGMPYGMTIEEAEEQDSLEEDEDLDYPF